MNERLTNDAAAAGETEAARAFPEDALILLPLRNAVLFPGVVLPFAIGRSPSIAAVQEAARRELPIGVVLQTDPETDTPTVDQLHRVGTGAHILRYVAESKEQQHVVCRGVFRFRIKEALEGYPFLVARVSTIDEEETVTPELEARVFLLKERAREVIDLLPSIPGEVADAVDQVTSASALADFVASLMDLEATEKQEILETLDINARLEKVIERLVHRIEVLRLSKQIGERTQETIAERQREHILREQLHQIQKELGETDEKEAEIAELREAIEEAGLPEEVAEQAYRELRRLERLPEGAAEFSMIRTYLDWLAELPWSVTTATPIDIAEARRILDTDHYGLEKIKKRILEYLAVRRLKPDGKGAILCFVGPPGVGKTSLGQSIARATGRRFIRISLGGVHDEAEIRGHRRTYVGAMPGNIIQGIRKAEAADPVFMLDEMDKLGVGFHGDPSASLLEVLDPAQNETFRDNYLGVPFDLSRVMFIGTANVLDNIPGPLRDRMEVIELPGYTEEEKVEIARRYLVGRQREANGLSEAQCTISEDALRAIARDYTREAGVRNLERQIAGICRAIAMRIAEGSTESVRIELNDLKDILGARRFENEVAMRTKVPGVATGLAWTPTGGDILFIEAARMPGSGKLILTGQLGDVMKESAQAALSLAKVRSTQLGIDPDLFEKSDIHIHVPAGAIPKDGPSAGVAIFTALVSLLVGSTVRNDVAMTGEISLRGLVLPIGGVKEKVLAAIRAGISIVLLPERNRKDLEDIPEGARERVNFIWMETVDDAVTAALETEENTTAAP